MTTYRWMIAGWVFLGVAALLAVVSIVEAFDALQPVTAQSFGTGPGTAPDAARVLLRAVVLGVLAGTAFFTGLACFFWDAARQRRRRLDLILDRLEASTRDDRRL